MNKTAVITSLTMLLSIAQYVWTAESAQRLEELRQDESRERYDERITPGRTRFRLEHFILPGIDSRQSIKNLEWGARTIVSLGGMALNYKKIAVATSTLGPVAGIAAALTTPSFMAASAATVVHLGGNSDHNVFANRPSSTPILRTYTKEIGGKDVSILHVEEAENKDKKTYFNMETGAEYSSLRVSNAHEVPGLCRGGYRVESLDDEGHIIEEEGTDWNPERKVRGKISVKMKTPELKNPRPEVGLAEDRRNPGEIEIWKCNGLCSVEQDGCPNGECSDHLIDTCTSPDGLNMRSFSLSLCGKMISVGFTNGAIGILHRNDEINTGGEQWTWFSDFEKQIGTSLSQYIQDHTEILRSGKLSRIGAVDKLDKASLIALGGSVHPVGALAATALIAKVDHDQNK